MAVLDVPHQEHRSCCKRWDVRAARTSTSEDPGLTLLLRNGGGGRKPACVQPGEDVVCGAALALEPDPAGTADGPQQRLRRVSLLKCCYPITDFTAGK